MAGEEGVGGRHPRLFNAEGCAVCETLKDFSKEGKGALGSLSRVICGEMRVSPKHFIKIKREKVPLSNPNSFGFKIAGQKKRRNKKPQTQL